MSSSQQNKKIVQQGEQRWKEGAKVSSELFALTYGALVMQLIRDHEDIDAVNIELEKMGYNIGQRLIDEYLAKVGENGSRCSDFKSMADNIAKIGFKMFLGINAEVGNWSSDEKTFTLVLSENPLTEFVELPPLYSNLCYSNIICGVIRGALEMVKCKVVCTFSKDTLKGESVNEITVSLKEILKEAFADDYKEN